MGDHLKDSRPQSLDENLVFFQHYCRSRRHSSDACLGLRQDGTKNMESERVLDAERLSLSVRPFWQRLPNVPEVELPGASGFPPPRPRLEPPSTSLCGAPPQSPACHHRMREAGGQMQEAVMKDLMEAKRASRGRADTAADLLLVLLSDMLLGRQPDLGDVALARGLLLRHTDPYQPLSLGRQMREANLEADVVRALMSQLGASSSSAASEPATPRSSRPGLQPPKPPDAATSRRSGGGAAAGAAGASEEASRSSERGAAEGGGRCAASCTAAAAGSRGSSWGSQTGDGNAVEGGGKEEPEGKEEEEVAGESLAEGLAEVLGLPAAAAPPPRVLSPRRRRQRLSWGARGSESGGQASGVGCSSGSDSDCGPQLLSPRYETAAATATATATAAAMSCSGSSGSVPPPVLEEVERVLALADAWQYDTWRLAEVTQGHALSCLGFYLLHREGLISQFRIRPTKLARLLRTLESGYPSNPYHNSTHAADVLQTLHVLLRGSGLSAATPGGHYLDRLGLMAAYFAAMIHDHGHPGLTSDFLVGTSHPLALRYNDRSPLENHHGASFFELMGQQGLEALEGLAGAERSAFRKLVLDLVLATDMKQHFALLAHFNTAHRLAPYNKEAGPWALLNTAAHSGGARGGGSSRHQQSNRCTPEPSGGDDAGAAAATVGRHERLEAAAGGVAVAVTPGEEPRPLDETERLLSLQIALKAADLGHLGEELGVHKRWVRCLEEEFFLQGDREAALGLPISPLFDRTKQGASKSQVGFYDFIALPLVHSLASAFPGALPLLAAFTDNYDHWRGVEKKAAAAAAAVQQQQAAGTVTVTGEGSQ
ncbi:hypothetical protein PLESTB_000940400 [Pleodorina starrii]|uniref:PDEase domain-containing protein n=1 Tax=Pleodorina starrii TaxID=330485 RepID=A0A9W6BNM6_9CHLO|nr:hypothetical protein PLESTB_000940400 [Pleodorina starrii]